MKRIISAAVLSIALLAAPVSQAASYQDRAMATGAVVGAIGGAVIGSGSNQALAGAIFGAVLGTIAGAMIASRQNQPVYVAQPRHHYATSESGYATPATHQPHGHPSGKL